MPGHKISLSKFKKIEIISSIFPKHNAMRLEINNQKKKTAKNTNTWKLNNMLLNNQWKKIKKHLETNKNKNTMIPNLRDAEKTVLREKFTVIQAYLRK